jgi:hypothetical protein
MPATLIRTSHLAIILCAALMPVAKAHAQTTWPPPGTHADYGTVEVITLSHPKVRHYCRVHSITADTITCGIGLARKPVLYRRDDVAGLLESANPDPLSQSIQHSLVTGCVAGTLTVLVVATAIASPTVALAILASAIAYGIYSEISPHTTWHAEAILYQRPNTPLTVHLRTH